MKGISDMSLSNFPVFQTCKSTLKETSKIDNNGYMCHLENEVINFDEAKEKYIRQQIEELIAQDEIGMKSVDALCEYGKDVLFIEFKSGDVGNIDKKDIRYKIVDSLLLFIHITKCQIDYIKEHGIFILVYNSGEKSLDKIQNHVFNNAGEERIRFGFKVHKKMFFKELHTYTLDEFENWLCQKGIIQ